MFASVASKPARGVRTRGSTAFGRGILTKTAAEDVRSYISGLAYAATRTAMMAMHGAKDPAVFLDEKQNALATRAGPFVWLSGDQSARITADTQQALYVPSDGDSTGASGCYARVVVTPYMRLDWAGGTMSGVAGADATALTALLALNAAGYGPNQIAIPYTATGCNLGSTSFTLGATEIIGIGGRPKLVSTSTALFNITQFSINVRSGGLQNLWIDMTGSSSGSVAVLFKTGSGIIFNSMFSDLTFSNCYHAFYDEVHATNYIVEVIFQRVYCYDTKDVQFLSRRSRGSVRLLHFKVDNTQGAQTTPVTWISVDIRDVVGVDLQYVNVAGPTTLVDPNFRSTAIGISITASGGSGSTVTMDNCYVDNTTGNGILIKDITNVQITRCYPYQNLGYQIKLDTCVKVKLSDNIAKGAVGLSGAPAGSNGIVITSCSDVTIGGGSVETCTGSGYSVANSTDIRAVNVESLSNTVTGWLDSGTTDRSLKQGLKSSGNGTNSLVQVGAASAAVNWYPNSGTFTASTTGATTV